MAMIHLFEEMPEIVRYYGINVVSLYYNLKGLGAGIVTDNGRVYSNLPISEG